MSWTGGWIPVAQAEVGEVAGYSCQDQEERALDQLQGSHFEEDLVGGPVPVLAQARGLYDFV